MGNSPSTSGRSRSMNSAAITTKLVSEFRSLDLDYGYDFSSHRVNFPHR
jgi:hypothetical protein